MPSSRAHALATRLEQGAAALARLASAMTDIDWQTKLPHDGRRLGLIVHHVASMYVLEMKLARTAAAGQAIEGVTYAAVDQINAQHAEEFGGAAKRETMDLLQRNSTAAAAEIRGFSDEELDRAVPMSLYEDAPLTCQFFLEDHPVRHSYHHLALIRRVLAAQAA
jgi:hypothetical protein